MDTRGVRRSWEMELSNARSRFSWAWRIRACSANRERRACSCDCSRTLATSELIMTPMTMKPENVTRYSLSATLKVRRGGTKKKSKARTPLNAVAIAGRNPSLTAAMTTANW